VTRSASTRPRSVHGRGLTIDGRNGHDTLDGGDGVELFIGGNGNDAVDGNPRQRHRSARERPGQLGLGPGDGSDVVEGQNGTDTLDFNGAGLDEIMSLSPNGERSLFLRNVANIRINMNGVERLDLTARRRHGHCQRHVGDRLPPCGRGPVRAHRRR